MYDKLLRSTRRHLRVLAFVKAFILWLCLCATTGGILLGLWPWASDSSVAASAVSALAVLFVSFSFIAFLTPSVFRKISFESILDEVERRYPQLKQRLSTAHYLRNHIGEARRLQFSRELMRETVRYADSQVDARYFESLRSWKPLRKPLLLLAILTGAWALVLVFGAGYISQIASAYRQSLGPARTLTAEERISVEGFGEVPRGEAAEITAGLEEPEAEAVIHYQQGNEPWRSQKMRPLDGENNKGNERFTFKFESVRKPIQCFVSTRAAVSEVGRIVPVDPPAVERFLAQINPPEYTALPPYQEERTNGNFEAPAGSQVSIEIVANNALASATLLDASKQKQELKIVNEKVARFATMLRLPMSYSLQLEDQRGLKSGAIGPFRLETTRDLAPRVFINDPPVVSDIGEDPVIQIDWEAIDDYGLSQIDLHYQVNYMDYGQMTTIAVAKTEDATVTASAQVFAPTSALRGIHRWNLAPFELLPGDEVSYYIVAWDNNAISGPQAATSEVHLLRFPTAMELFEETQGEQVSQIESYEKLLEQQREIQKEAEKIRESIEEQSNQGDARPAEGQEEQTEYWEERQKMEQLSDKQQQLGEQLEQLREQIDQTLDQLNNPGSFSTKTVEKMAKIQELLDQLLSDEMKAVIQQFQRTVDELARQQPLEAMDELDLSMEEFEENLDRTLSLLEQSLAEQQLEAMVNQAEQLEQNQQDLQQQADALNERMEQLEQEEAGMSEEQKQAEQQAIDEQKQALAEQQEQLKEQSDQLLEQMEQMAKDQAGKNEQLSQALKEALKQTERQQLGQSMQQAMERLQQGQMQQASSAQECSRQALAQLKQNLSAAQGAMGGKDFKKDMTALQRTLDRALVLSERQEQVLNDLTMNNRPLLTWPPETKTRVSLLQRHYRDESARIEKQLLEIAKKDPFLNFDAIRLLRLATRSMHRAVASAEDGGPNDMLNQSRLAMDQINTAVLLLLESLDQLAQAQAQAGMQGYFQSLEDLIQQQKKLNMRTRQHLEQGRKMGQTPSWQQQLQQMLQQQAAIRRKTQELFRKYGKLEELLGNLDKASQEMREVEKQMEDQQTDQRIEEKQERILSRLLDAEKSAQEKGISEERESETAGVYEPSAPPGLPETAASVQSRIQRLGHGWGEENIPVEFRHRVRTYFRRLSEQAVP